jgi:hypothetical protein
VAGIDRRAEAHLVEAADALRAVRDVCAADLVAVADGLRDDLAEASVTMAR